MPVVRDVARASLYRGKINLWVEDDLTRAYLSAVWNDPNVTFLIGGGNEGVRAIVSDAEKAGFANVFALIDGDTGETNKSGWMDPKKTFRTFVLPVHEIENYLLDAASLSASRFNNLKKTVDEIEHLMNKMASRRCWWAACRDVVAELRKRFRESFSLSFPDDKVNSEASAQSHICDSSWYKTLAEEFGRSTDLDIHKLLADAHNVANQGVSDGRWKERFPGKELFHHVGSGICDHTQRRKSSSTQARSEFHEDLAKEIGAWQRANNKVPRDRTDLLEALGQRIARPQGGR